jgi:hypothetical protein
MEGYEGTQVGDVALLAPSAMERPERTRLFYRRLFDAQGNPTLDFQTWASETLATWTEESFEQPVGLLMNEVHHNDPVYDVLAAVRDSNAVLQIRIIQVKATSNNLAANCNVAPNKFKSLEDGEYDAELSSKLNLMKKTGVLPADAQPRELLFDLGKRSYRVTALHQEDRDPLQLMTTYEEKVPGELARRSARLIRLVNWTEFWAVVARSVYAQLS